MLRFYWTPGKPNPAKIALYLEEVELPYTLEPVDLGQGEQHAPSFTAINPNAKVPALIDEEQIIFDSNAILLYLADKTGKFRPEAGFAGEYLSWMFFLASGLAPFSGQAIHFQNYAPQPQNYATERYRREAERHWHIVEERLGRQQYLVGESYSVVDMNFWGWAPAIPMLFGENAWQKFPNCKRLFDEVSARPAAARAMEICKLGYSKDAEQ